MASDTDKRASRWSLANYLFSTKARLLASLALIFLILWSTSLLSSGPSAHDFEAHATSMLRKHESSLTNSISKTSYITGLPGHTYWKNVYLLNGTFFIVSDDHENLVPADYILSDPPTPDRDHPGASNERLQIITTAEAKTLLGLMYMKKPGLTMFFNDQTTNYGPSYLNHYYHFVAEVFMSAWRVVCSADSHPGLPSRLMFRAEPTDWRDHAGLTRWFQQAVMPDAVIEDGPLWRDSIASQIPLLFERIVIVDRWAAHRYNGEVARWNKMTGNLPQLQVPEDWWNPVRDGLKSFLQANGCVLGRKKKGAPVVTYINRQKTGRRLLSQHDFDLVHKLQALHDEGVIEFHDAQMETYKRNEQFCLAMRTEIMIGVHGNGLTHQLWMPTGSALLEIMYEGGFAMDYALPAELMGHEYFAIHHDRIFPKNSWIKLDGTAVAQVPGFHDSKIRVDGQFVASLIRGLAVARSGKLDGR